MDEAVKRKPGRPRVHPDDGPRRSVTMQMAFPLYTRLAEAAGAAGVSLSREIQERVEKSFVAQDIRETIREEMRRHEARAEEDSLRAYINRHYDLTPSVGVGNA